MYFFLPWSRILIDFHQVTTLVQKLIADHTRLRQRATSSGDQSATLNAKVEELTNKVTKLLTEKMELMEQVKETVYIHLYVLCTANAGDEYAKTRFHLTSDLQSYFGRFL